MIKHLFTNHKRFAVFFFLILLIDIIVKLNCEPYYRFISKPWLTITLLGYFYFNTERKNDRKHKFVILALIAFLLGDLISILNKDNFVLIGLTLLFFSLAKVFLSAKFCHEKDFNISKLIPFTFVLFAYTVFMVWFLYDDLKVFFAPALVTFFLSLLLLQFAFLRQVVFKSKNFKLVFWGVIFYVASEGVEAILLFKNSFPAQGFFNMLFYGVGLYCVVRGVILEKENKLLETEIQNKKTTVAKSLGMK